MNNEYQLLNTFFMDELKKNPHCNLTKYTEKEQKVFDFKKDKIQSLINGLGIKKGMGLYVRSYKDFDSSTYVFSNELIPFDYIIRDTSIINNKPSPAIYIESPYCIEISVANKLEDDIYICYEINPLSCAHPDKDMLKRKYIDFNECMKDIYRFLAKNLYQDNHLTL